MKNITPNNILNFIEGNLRMAGDRINLLPLHEKEQVLYRISKCPDCMAKRACKYCGCSVPGKMYVKKSCNNGEIFPDMMSLPEWEDFKKFNNIEVKK